MPFVIYFDPQMCFSLVNLIHKITNKKDKRMYLQFWYFVGLQRQHLTHSKDKKIVYPIENTREIISTVCIELI